MQNICISIHAYTYTCHAHACRCPSCYHNTVMLLVISLQWSESTRRARKRKCFAREPTCIDLKSVRNRRMVLPLRPMSTPTCVCIGRCMCVCVCVGVCVCVDVCVCVCVWCACVCMRVHACVYVCAQDPASFDSDMGLHETLHPVCVCARAFL